MSSAGVASASWGQSLSADLERLIASPPFSLADASSIAIFRSVRCFNAAYPTYSEWNQASQVSKPAWDAVVIKCIAAGRRLTRAAREYPQDLHRFLWPLPVDVALADIILVLRAVARDQPQLVHLSASTHRFVLACVAVHAPHSPWVTEAAWRYVHNVASDSNVVRYLVQHGLLPLLKSSMLAFAWPFTRAHPHSLLRCLCPRAHANDPFAHEPSCFVSRMIASSPSESGTASPSSSCIELDWPGLKALICSADPGAASLRWCISAQLNLCRNEAFEEIAFRCGFPWYLLLLLRRYAWPLDLRQYSMEANPTSSAASLPKHGAIPLCQSVDFPEFPAWPRLMATAVSEETVSVDLEATDADERVAHATIRVEPILDHCMNRAPILPRSMHHLFDSLHLLVQPAGASSVPVGAGDYGFIFKSALSLIWHSCCTSFKSWQDCENIITMPSAGQNQSQMRAFQQIFLQSAQRLGARDGDVEASVGSCLTLLSQDVFLRQFQLPHTLAIAIRRSLWALDALSSTSRLVSVIRGCSPAEAVLQMSTAALTNFSDIALHAQLVNAFTSIWHDAQFTADVERVVRISWVGPDRDDAAGAVHNILPAQAVGATAVQDFESTWRPHWYASPADARVWSGESPFSPVLTALNRGLGARTCMFHGDSTGVTSLPLSRDHEEQIARLCRLSESCCSSSSSSTVHRENARSVVAVCEAANGRSVVGEFLARLEAFSAEEVPLPPTTAAVTSLSLRAIEHLWEHRVNSALHDAGFTAQSDHCVGESGRMLLWSVGLGSPISNHILDGLGVFAHSLRSCGCSLTHPHIVSSQMHRIIFDNAVMPAESSPSVTPEFAASCADSSPIPSAAAWFSPPKAMSVLSCLDDDFAHIVDGTNIQLKPSSRDAGQVLRFIHPLHFQYACSLMRVECVSGSVADVDAQRASPTGTSFSSSFSSLKSSVPLKRVPISSQAAAAAQWLLAAEKGWLPLSVEAPLLSLQYPGWQGNVVWLRLLRLLLIAPTAGVPQNIHLPYGTAELSSSVHADAAAAKSASAADAFQRPLHLFASVSWLTSPAILAVQTALLHARPIFIGPVIKVLSAMASHCPALITSLRALGVPSLLIAPPPAPFWMEHHHQIQGSAHPGKLDAAFVKRSARIGVASAVMAEALALQSSRHDIPPGSTESRVLCDPNLLILFATHARFTRGRGADRAMRDRWLDWVGEEADSSLRECELARDYQHAESLTSFLFKRLRRLDDMSPRADSAGEALDMQWPWDSATAQFRFAHRVEREVIVSTLLCLRSPASPIDELALFDSTTASAPTPHPIGSIACALAAAPLFQPPQREAVELAGAHWSSDNELCQVSSVPSAHVLLAEYFMFGGLPANMWLPRRQPDEPLPHLDEVLYTHPRDGSEWRGLPAPDAFARLLLRDALRALGGDEGRLLAFLSTDSGGDDTGAFAHRTALLRMVLPLSGAGDEQWLARWAFMVEFAFDRLGRQRELCVLLSGAASPSAVGMPQDLAALIAAEMNPLGYPSLAKMTEDEAAVLPADTHTVLDAEKFALQRKRALDAIVANVVQELGPPLYDDDRGSESENGTDDEQDP